jgi:N-acetylneuraminic acid mutarotase
MRKSLALLLVLVFLTASCLAVKPALSSADVTENSWVSKAPMHQARSRLGAVAVNGKIYAIGGNAENGIIGTNEEYDPATDTWRGRMPMPTPRKGFAIASYEGKIYCIGGYTANGSTTGVNEVYDTATNTWETKTPMPTARWQLKANVVNGKIYLIGGFVADNSSSGYGTSNLNEVYDTATDTWIQKTPATYNSLGRATAALDGKIYVLSGSFDNLVTTMNQIYDTQTDTWTFGSSAPTYFMSGSAIATTGLMAPKRIYVFDKPSPDLAVNPNAPLYSTQVYDPETDSWMAGADLPTSRAEVAVAIINDKIYVIGGYSATYDNLPYDYTPKITQYRTVEQYTPFGYGTAPPIIDVVSPVDQTYNVSSVSLDFTVNKPALWIGYSLNGQDNVTINGNTTLSGLSSGLHNVTVYAKDTFGNVGVSETVSFSVETPFPTTLVVTAFGVAVVIVGAGLLVYFKKRKH